MTPEGWETVKELFQLALERAPNERRAFLDAFCRDNAELRREVESLLAHATASDRLLEDPIRKRIGVANTSGGPNALAPHWVPATIGRYRVLSLIGEGGMGAVYKAEQELPRRIVALKIIKPGLANADVLRRFDRESQALGRLQHPGIAQIHEAGTADTGFGAQPYFAMEFIVGEPLKEYVAARRLDTRGRLELIAALCDAMQHAHDRGLIHRDLKPSNILVDRTGQPKILDFGVARFTEGPAPETRQTNIGQLVGTLAYMSPEQVLADPLELDARSDVYALGVIAYELLAGRLPYSVSVRLNEAMQTIREDDPDRLSTIDRAYRGDIETIVAKALEKDKARRYQSAAALADDIRRYLDDEPIAARPASATYQLQKFARRHKALVGGVAAVFVVLVAGIVVSTWQAGRAFAAQRLAVDAEVRAARERDEATKERNRAVEAQQQAQQERNEAVAEKQRADTEAATVRAVSDFVRGDLLAQASTRAQSRSGSTPDPDLKVRTALDHAAARISGSFREQPLVEASIRQTIGEAYQDLGLYAQARQHLERALDLRKNTLGENDRATLEILGNLAASYTLEGKYQRAEPLYRRVVDGLRRAYGDEDPEVLKALSEQAGLYRYQGHYARAETLALKALDIERRVLGPEHPTTLMTADTLALIYTFSGKYPRAETLYAQVLDARRRLMGAEHPDTLETTSDLAFAYALDGKHGNAEPLYLKALDGERRVLGPEHPHTLDTMGDLALLYRNQGRYKETEALYLEILAARRRVLGNDHPNTLSTLNNLGGLYSAQNRLTEAETVLTQGLEGSKRTVGAEHPNTLFFMINIAGVYFRQGRAKESERLFVEVLALRRRVLGPEHPDTLFVMNNLGVVYMRQGKLREAESMFTQLLDIQRRALGEDHPETLRAADNLGATFLRAGNLAQAEPILTRAFEGRVHKLGAENPDTLRSAENLASAYAELGRTDQAEALMSATLTSARRGLGEQHPQTLSSAEKLAEIDRRQGKLEAAHALLTDVVAVRRRVLGPRHPETTQSLSMLGFVCLQQQKYVEVESLLRDVASAAKDATDPWSRYYGESVLGAALTAEQKYAEAEDLLVDGYQGMIERTATIPADSNVALVRAGEWIIELYRAWGKPERAGEWSNRLAAAR